MWNRLLWVFSCWGVLACFSVGGRAAEPGAGDACATKGQFLISGGAPDNETVLLCNGTVWNSVIVSKSGGNVGIGTSSPGSLLTVQGNLNGFPFALLEISNSALGIASYAEMAFSGNQRTYFIGTANSSETATGVANKFFVWDHKSRKYRLVIDTSGNFGIGTTDPQATLDVAGFMRLAKNSVEPVACSGSNDGAIALTHTYTLCICKGGSNSWIKAHDSASVCKW